MATSWEEKFYESQKEITELKKSNIALRERLEAQTLKSRKTINAYNQDIWDEIQEKISMSDEDGLKLMIKRKIISVYDVDSSGQTILMLAARYGCYKLAQFCINAGADPHQTDNKGQNALDLSRSIGWYNIERLLLFAQLNADVGNEIKNTAENIQKQQGIIDNLFFELSLIGKQNKELFEKILMELMINIINKRSSFDDNLLNLCWEIVSRDGKNPLLSELWTAISTQCKEIIQNGGKRDWYWFKKCLIPSTV